MIQLRNESALLDACVLYPAPVRDFLLSVAAEYVFMPKWSREIQDEWVRNLLLNRPDLNKEQLSLTVTAMNIAFPEASVENYGSYINSVVIPDPKDRHVIAAAIKSNSSVIVTFNLKHFPNSLCRKHHLIAIGPDQFLIECLKSYPNQVIRAFEKMVKRLKNPPKTYSQVLNALWRCNLPEIVKELEKIYA